MKVPPLVTTALGLLATLTFMASPVVALVFVVVFVVGLALVDGRPRTALAIVAGQALYVGGALLTLALALRDPPPGSRSHAGLAFMVMPWALVISAIATAAVFAAAHHARRIARRSKV